MVPVLKIFSFSTMFESHYVFAFFFFFAFSNMFKSLHVLKYMIFFLFLQAVALEQDLVQAAIGVWTVQRASSMMEIIRIRIHVNFVQLAQQPRTQDRQAVM